MYHSVGRSVACEQWRGLASGALTGVADPQLGSSVSYTPRDVGRHAPRLV